MLTYHATIRTVLRSIRKGGLQRRRAKQRRKAVWLVSPDRIGWALEHAQRRHGVRPDAVVLLEVDIPADWLRGYRHRGLYYCPCDVPPEMIGRALGWSMAIVKE